MHIPFQKAHGARNDFLLTWAAAVPQGDRRQLARAICDRHSGVGADGWLVVTPPQPGEDVNGSIVLFNSDGSDSEISGNGTRCAAAFLAEGGLAGDTVRIRTGAGVKHLQRKSRHGRLYEYEMNMGRAKVLPDDLHFPLSLPNGTFDVTILDIGNPQCVLFGNDLDLDWRTMGRAIEWHSRFPRRTNVSFVKVRDRHTLDVLFWERGAGETASSGTGSTGAAAAAILRGLVEPPVVVHTPAGPLSIRLQSGDLYLTGPAQIVVSGEFYLESEH